MNNMNNMGHMNNNHYGNHKKFDRNPHNFSENKNNSSNNNDHHSQSQPPCVQTKEDNLNNISELNTNNIYKIVPDSSVIISNYSYDEIEKAVTFLKIVDKIKNKEKLMNLIKGLAAEEELEIDNDRSTDEQESDKNIGMSTKSA
jgi:hypothetical protein